MEDRCRTSAVSADELQQMLDVFVLVNMQLKEANTIQIGCSGDGKLKEVIRKKLHPYVEVSRN